jgi:quercetin dioxygenase-like cupin family protein
MKDESMMPRVINPSEGIQIIEDVTDQPGVETIEGIFGPLMQGAGSQAHFIKLPPGLYTYEHVHPNESIIYTVKGKWVLCSSGIRHIIKEKGLFWFGPNIGTGYENPFDEPAFLLIFKGKVLNDSAGMIKYLQGPMKEHLASEVEKGHVFTLEELPEDHPAREFAVAQGWKAE